MSRQSVWWPVEGWVATRARAASIRDAAIEAGATVLDFARCEGITVGAADELVCKHAWEATTGENEWVRENVVTAIGRRK